VVTSLNERPRILMNSADNGNHWLLLDLRGTKSNRMAIGAKVRLTTSEGFVEYNHVTTSVGYASSSDPRVHFGLGSARSAREIQIIWPSGIHQTLHNVAADRVVPITEPSQ